MKDEENTIFGSNNGGRKSRNGRRQSGRSVEMAKSIFIFLFFSFPFLLDYY